MYEIKKLPIKVRMKLVKASIASLEAPTSSRL